WNTTDIPVGGNILNNFTNGTVGELSTSLVKPLPTGGVAGITFDTRYTLLSAPPAGNINPTYRPSLTFGFDQPLLQGFGVELNELLPRHPGATPLSGSSLNGLTTPSGVVATTTASNFGILVTRLRFDESRAQFEAAVNRMVLNVEVAYWN